MVGKKGQTQFVWIFSLIIGAIILFLAIFSAQRFTETAEIQTQAELTREFDVLLNPFASVGSIATMTLSKKVRIPTEVQIKFSCSADDNFNELNLRTKSKGAWQEWPLEGFKIRDKYVFAEELEGQDFWIFSKQLEMPWRVDDLIYITDKTYCFEDAPEHIEREVDSLDSNVIGIEGDCPAGSVEVCFSRRGCPIEVNYPLGSVKKEGKTILFADDALMYGAIFSDSRLYQCNFERLIERIKTQIEINLEKAIILEGKGCNTGGLQSSLRSMEGAFKGRLIGNFESIADEVARRNPKECAVF